MANYVLAYRGGGTPEGEEEQKRVYGLWGAWFGQLGGAIVDAGNPVGESRSIAADGSVSGGPSAGLTGYSILSAEGIDAAVELAKGCPLLESGGNIEVYEVIPVV